MLVSFPTNSYNSSCWKSVLCGINQPIQVYAQIILPTLPATLRGDTNYERAGGQLSGLQKINGAVF
jgi:hypothetical protein